jgi:hypothetical protein
MPSVYFKCGDIYDNPDGILPLALAVHGFGGTCRSMLQSKHMKRTFCWACTLLGTIAAFSVFALLAKPAAPVLAAISINLPGLIG